jgi:hypothetical protein
MHEGEDKSELLERVRVGGSGIAAGVVMESEVMSGTVVGRELSSGGVTGWKLAAGGVLAVLLFDDTLGAGCPRVDMVATDVRAGLLSARVGSFQ